MNLQAYFVSGMDAEGEAGAGVDGLGLVFRASGLGSGV